MPLKVKGRSVYNGCCKVHEKRYKAFEKQLKKARDRWRRRFLRKVRRKREGPYRRAVAVLILSGFFYLFFLRQFGEQLFQVREESAVVLKKEGADGFFQGTLSKIIFRLKTGEIIFYHERAKEETLP